MHGDYHQHINDFSLINAMTLLVPLVFSSIHTCLYCIPSVFIGHDCHYYVYYHYRHIILCCFLIIAINTVISCYHPNSSKHPLRLHFVSVCPRHLLFLQVFLYIHRCNLYACHSDHHCACYAFCFATIMNF